MRKYLEKFINERTVVMNQKTFDEFKAGDADYIYAIDYGFDKNNNVVVAKKIDVGLMLYKIDTIRKAHKSKAKDK